MLYYDKQHYFIKVQHYTMINGDDNGDDDLSCVYLSLYYMYFLYIIIQN